MNACFLKHEIKHNLSNGKETECFYTKEFHQKHLEFIDLASLWQRRVINQVCDNNHPLPQIPF